MKARAGRPGTPAEKDQKAPTAAPYHVGTLVYSRGDLQRLFFWLLLGDFASNVMGAALPTLLPLQLSARGVSAATIGWVLSLAPLATIIFSPFLGVWSDRLRTRWGRRRPFLIVSTPIVAAGMLLLPHIQNMLLLQVVVTVVQIANVLQTILLYLYADIMPPSLMGRFMGGFSFVGALGTMAFQYFLVPWFGTAPTMVWTICAIFYFVLFQLSVHNVREGQYPAPEPTRRSHILRGYLKDGAGSWYIWCLWAALGMNALAGPAGLYYNLLCRDQLGMSMRAIGMMNTVATIPRLFVMLPGGWLIDRFGPRKLWGLFSLLSGGVTLGAWFWVRGSGAMLLYMLLSGALGAFTSVALMPMLYAHLPKDKFGQLVSMQSVVMFTLIFLSTNAVGQLITLRHGDYFITFLYGGPIMMLTPIFILLLARAKNPFAGMATALARDEGVPVREGGFDHN